MNEEKKELTLDESIKQVMQTLPAPIRNYLAQGKYTPVAKSLMSKYGLRIDQAGILEREIMLLLMGIEDPSEFATALTEEGALTSDAVQKIVADVNQLIFVPLREEMRRVGNAPSPQQAPIPQMRPQPTAPPRPVPTPVTPSPRLTSAPTAPPTPTQTVRPPVPQLKTPMPKALPPAGMLPPKMMLPNAGTILSGGKRVPPAFSKTLPSIIPKPTPPAPNVPPRTSPPPVVPKTPVNLPPPSFSGELPKEKITPPQKGYAVDPYREPIE